jgi:predicted transcriptional regulator
MTRDDEKELAEVVLRTRRWAFRDAFPEILGAVRQFVSRQEALRDERRRGAERMIRDYREIICRR